MGGRRTALFAPSSAVPSGLEACLLPGHALDKPFVRDLVWLGGLEMMAFGLEKGK